MDSVSSVVPSATSAGRPASEHIAAMEVAIADRNIKPTSCTCSGHGRCKQRFKGHVVHQQRWRGMHAKKHTP
eukprot:1158233-Pelagomonas_calceolata.AAC.13